MISKDLIVRRSIEQNFQQFADSRMVRITGKATQHYRDQLQDLCTRPEYAPLLVQITFRFEMDLQQPFIVRENGMIILRPDLLQERLMAVVLIRQALEISMLRRLLPGQQDPVTQITIASLACHTATAYWLSLPGPEKTIVRNILPNWLVSLGDKSLGDVNILLDHINLNIDKILPLQDVNKDYSAWMDSNTDIRTIIHALLAETITLGYPSEWLMTRGGDNRLIVDPVTGLNKYGCSPKPRPSAVTFASCTGSSISDMAYVAAERLRQDLLLDAFQDGLGNTLLNQADRTRREILRALTLDNIPGTEIILSSSGTDSELIALFFSLGGHNEVVTNIILAPNEIGSGTIPAASGCHFDSITPMGAEVKPGTPVRGIAAERVELVKIPVRDDLGNPISIEQLDLLIQKVVDRSCSAGYRVLLHLIDSSKTGVGAPSIEAAKIIKKRYSTQVNVLVDAAQMRLSRQALRDYVRNGFLVLITGSKFFTGPPFSGALVIPSAVAQQVDSLPMFPEGFEDYATPSDFPSRWWAQVSHLPEHTNIGLLLRWQAALWEIKAFYATSPSNQFDTVRRFLTRIIMEIQENPDLELVTAPALERLQDDSEAQWDRIQTIFSFLVRRHNKSQNRYFYLNYEEAKFAYRWLNMDISCFLPKTAQDEEKRVAGILCHIGQPVRIFMQKGTWYAALRIAIGARLISGVEFDPMLGDSPAKRINIELTGAMTILKKLSVISHYWDYIAATGTELQQAE